MSTYAAAALTVWAFGMAVSLAFWIGRGKCINDWRAYCAYRSQERAAVTVRSEDLWAELERLDHGRQR